MSDEETNVVQLIQPEAATLSIWNKLEKTDPAFTSKMTTGAKLTSINPEYQMKRMTELFGPIGTGWGYEIMSSEMIDGGPTFMQHSQDSEPFEDGRVLVHTARVVVWYRLQEEAHLPDQPFHKINGTGHTPFRTQATTKLQTGAEIYGGGRVDMEYEKKSITDAVTKAMSLLGMTADVRMKMFENAGYVQGLRDEFAANAVTDAVMSEEEAIRQKHEFEDWLGKISAQVSAAATIRDVELAFKPAMIRVMRQGTKEQVTALTDTKNAAIRRIASEDRAQRDAKKEAKP